jgi:hypothetical protein
MANPARRCVVHCHASAVRSNCRKTLGSISDSDESFDESLSLSQNECLTPPVIENKQTKRKIVKQFIRNDDANEWLRGHLRARIHPR